MIHEVKVDATTYQRGNRTWHLVCSCGWAQDISTKGFRRAQAEARARSHEKDPT